MAPTYAPITPGERDEAHALWTSVFGAPLGYFQRYFDVDPWYREGDSFGARVEGRLVSAVHLCRRPVEWKGRTLWCGAIANVATYPEYRRQGLSRELLRLTIARMEETGMDFSMLFTGTHAHYAPLGWEQVHTPVATVTLSVEAAQPTTVPEPARVDEAHLRLYSSTPRPLQLSRPEPYFNGWTGWSWTHWNAQGLLNDSHGYAVLRIPEEAEHPARLMEWAAADAESERELLLEAAHIARARGKERLQLEALPAHGSAAALRELGTVQVDTTGGMMLCNGTLPDADYWEVVRLYASGEAVW
ncbi:MAG TPA: GNAT family N-acetyltransferase, partial [Armatimonadota bacterium]|nr:GNAT family N-acetyltransferase [Armatimonadota bacterium]